MKEKAAFLTVFSILLSSAFVPRFAAPVVPQEVPNQYQIVTATAVEPPFSVDPAWAYEKSTQELIFNVYETLLFYDRENMKEFVPMLATEWQISNNGLTYTFEIREGVKFHNGETLTTEDIEYSFERVMVHDKFSGPLMLFKFGTAWTLYEPLLDVLEANLTDPTFGQEIDNAIQRNSTHVWFRLTKPYAPFLKILSQPWCSVVNKKFCLEHGDWPGTWENWQNYHNLDDSPLDYPEQVMCGTGPYIFDYLREWVEWSIVKNDDYWGGWPAPGCRGYVERATWKTTDIDWLTRKEMFLSGDVDMVYVPRANIIEVFGEPGIRCVYPLPELIYNGIFFNCNISLGSRFLKPPFSVELGYRELNESGIPPDFFSDIDVRKGFAYSINYTEFLQSALHDEAVYPGTPAIEGLPFKNPEQEKYELDMTKAEEHFKKAWNGQLWTTGFKVTIRYKEGYLPSIVICEMLKANVESLNPKFHIELLMIPKIEDVYVGSELFEGKLPLFIVYYSVADYPDPHNLFYNFMHSNGLFTGCQRYSNATVDALVEEGLHTMNETRRREIYFELQQAYFDDCPSVILYQTTGRHWERDWVQGWYYNPAYPGLYFYHLWKEDLPPEDLNSDGTVDIFDVVSMSKAFGSCYEPGKLHSNWDSRADLIADQAIDIFDVVKIAKRFGYKAPTWTPP